MALNYEQKILIAYMKAANANVNTIARALGISRDAYYRAIKSDNELGDLCNDIATTVKNEKARACASAKEQIRQHFENNSNQLVQLFADIITVPKEVIDASSLRDRMGAGKLLLEMMEKQIAQNENEGNEDETPAIIEVVVEDASGGE